MSIFINISEAMFLTRHLGALLALVSQARTSHYRGYLDGNQNLGLITEMTVTRSAVTAQVNTTGHHLTLEIL